MHIYKLSMASCFEVFLSLLQYMYRCKRVIVLDGTSQENDLQKVFTYIRSDDDHLMNYIQNGAINDIGRNILPPEAPHNETSITFISLLRSNERASDRV